MPLLVKLTFYDGEAVFTIDGRGRKLKDGHMIFIKCVYIDFVSDLENQVLIFSFQTVEKVEHLGIEDSENLGKPISLKYKYDQQFRNYAVQLIKENSAKFCECLSFQQMPTFSEYEP